MFAIKIADRDIYILAKKGPSREWCSATPENGRLAFLTSGRPAFRQHTEHAEGSDTTPSFARAERPCAQDVQTAISTETKKGLRSPAGPRRLGTVTRISASLFRRLSAFFGSTLGQDPKAAKYAVLTPGPGMFVNVRNAPRVVIAAPSGRPLFRRACRCVRSCWRRQVCTRRSPSKRTLRRLCRRC